ncbi:MAG: hypothetical protein G01um101448_1137 [Parcubacteria group bacterium Gr01-1014_48]|nr:MAG: hypothetical protein Greene041614_1023 [Parcubacteria group bacterium Greene0416_14]TSC71574.1 MAG: hypothetical protein G01um101448_1137 [Parcubacteria group bacterium Gr01-1014_48]TSC99801.1 MAG: hypothetical protein Greene101415_1084 [Parcubacteria group bacterium Greene1014_15]TSD07840.1 MAG: hypothetical protein Greene07144_674 [Parcubacteria group bacterium Greene0714_4]
MQAKLDPRLREYLQKTIIYTDSEEKQHVVNVMEEKTGNNPFAEELSIKFCLSDAPLTEEQKKDVAATYSLNTLFSYTFTAAMNLEENFDVFAQFVHQEMMRAHKKFLDTQGDVN